MSKYTATMPVKAGKPPRLHRPGDEPFALTKAEAEQLGQRVSPAGPAEDPAAKPGGKPGGKSGGKSESKSGGKS